MSPPNLLKGFLFVSGSFDVLVSARPSLLCSMDCIEDRILGLLIPMTEDTCLYRQSWSGHMELDVSVIEYSAPHGLSTAAVC